MQKESDEPKEHSAIPAENVIEDCVSVVESAGAGSGCVRFAGSAGYPGEHATDVVDAQRSAKSETARAFLSGSELGTYPVG